MDFNNLSDNFGGDNSSKPLTEVFGVKLNSEHTDTQLYNIIRSIQFILAHSHNLKERINIEETECATGYYYTITNNANNLRTYVGRTKNGKNNKISGKLSEIPITLMFLDQARIRWMYREGFDPTNENCARVGTIGVFEDLFSLTQFLAGKDKFKVMEYCRAE